MYLNALQRIRTEVALHGKLIFIRILTINTEGNGMRGK